MQRICSILVLSLSACAHSHPPSVTTVVCQDPSQSKGLEPRLAKDTVVAKWNGGELTYGAVSPELKPALRELKNKYLGDLHNQELDVINARVARAVINQEAARRGVNDEEYMSSVAKNAPKIDDARVQEFYDANRSRLNQPFEIVSGQIRAYLEGEAQKEIVRAEIEKLYEAANVELLLPEPQLIPINFDLTGRPRKGPENAAVTIVEFSDFECPYCRLAASDLERRLESRKDQVALVFLHYPLSFHKKAKPAAIASECAHQQGSFWEFHDAIFAAQDSLNEEFYVKTAKNLKLDVERFKACLTDPKAREEVEKDMKQAQEAGVKGTPSLFINGIPARRGVPSNAELDALIQATP